MDDIHTDGNGIAGLLTEVLSADPTTVVRRCHSCGDARPMGEHRAYRGAGIVLRCPSCGDVALVVADTPGGCSVELRGRFSVQLR